MTLAMTAVLPPPARIAPPTSAPAGSAPADRSIELSQARAVAAAIIDAVTAVVAGQRTAVELATACLLSRGHLLIEDVPGVGKTLLAQAITGAVGGSFRRIQGSVDLLPGDVTGTLVPDTHHDHLRLTFRPGPIFANVVVFDELNRTNPRTQSALLEAAEERTVTIDGHSHLLPDPFFLVATQNPIEVAGIKNPIIMTRKAESTVELGSGQTFALAGLLKNEASNSVDKFPGLGDMPVLGSLFRSQSFQNNRTELVILVTPYIVRPVSDHSKMQTPDEGYVPPSDLQRIMHGSLYQQQPMNKEDELPALNGEGGFIQE